LIWRFILGFPTEATCTLASLKCRFKQVVNIGISRAPFRGRLAAAKMHVIANAKTGGRNSVKLIHQRIHDSHPFTTVDRWVEGYLLANPDTLTLLDRLERQTLDVAAAQNVRLGDSGDARVPRPMCFGWSAAKTLTAGSIISTL